MVLLSCPCSFIKRSCQDNFPDNRPEAEISANAMREAALAGLIVSARLYS